MSNAPTSNPVPQAEVQEVPILVDRCGCKTKGGRPVKPYTSLPRFNSHSVHHLLKEKFCGDILKDVIGSSNMICMKCITPVNRTPKTFLSRKATLMHFIEHHIGDPQQLKIYYCINELFPVREDDEDENPLDVHDVDDEDDARSKFTSVSQLTYGSKLSRDSRVSFGAPMMVDNQVQYPYPSPYVSQPAVKSVDAQRLDHIENMLAQLTRMLQPNQSNNSQGPV
jgi:hypothetical protein